jgi:hypothetical protein
MPKPKAKQAPHYSALVSTEVEVDLDPDDLHDAGWHHESECAGGRQKMAAAPPVSLGLGWVGVTAALESLHRQAHGDGPIMLCRAEPCSSLSLDQLRGAA